jgi:hypothetical protein
VNRARARAEWYGVFAARTHKDAMTEVYRLATRKGAISFAIAMQCYRWQVRNWHGTIIATNED